jgi:putative DNA primase/helicase
MSDPNIAGEAPGVKPGYAKGKILILDPKDPVKTAEKFKAAVRPNIVQQDLLWYDYVGTHYKPLEAATLYSDVQHYMIPAMVATEEGLTAFKPTPYDVNNAIRALAGLKQVHLPTGTRKPPMWLDDTPSDPRRVLPCQNGLFDLEARKLLPHTPKFFCTYVLPMEYQPSVTAPAAWPKTLLEIFDGRQHLVDALQEAIGYTISGDRSQETIFFARGVKRGGKGFIVTVMSHLVGLENTASFSFGDAGLGERHGLAEAPDKVLLIVPDATLSKRPGSLGLATTRLKSISGGDPVTIRPLFKPPYTVVLPGQWWFLCNIVPNFGADADAINGRGLYFPFDVSFIGREDRTLKDPRRSPYLNKQALTGILNWAIEGLDRLQARGRFAEWPESLEIKREVLLASNPLVSFIDTDCELKTGTDVEKGLLYQVYLMHCEQHGIEPKTSHHFSTDIKNAAAEMGPHCPRQARTRRRRLETQRLHRHSPQQGQSSEVV